MQANNSQEDTALDHFSEEAGRSLVQLIDFLQSLNPQMNRIEATYLSSVILNNLPSLIENNLSMNESIKNAADRIVSARPSNVNNN